MDKYKHQTIKSTHAQTHIMWEGKPKRNLPKLNTNLTQVEGPSNSNIKGSKSEPSYSPIEDQHLDNKLKNLNWINPTIKEQTLNNFLLVQPYFLLHLKVVILKINI